jgi:hypothetical protein
MRTAPNLTYLHAKGGKLDVYAQPPTISIHGDADPLVPYAHSTKLHDALQKAGVAHEMVTIAAGAHGNFSVAEWQRAFAAVEKFLADVRASKPPATAGRRSRLLRPARPGRINRVGRTTPEGVRTRDVHAAGSERGAACCSVGGCRRCPPSALRRFTTR